MVTVQGNARVNLYPAFSDSLVVELDYQDEDGVAKDMSDSTWVAGVYASSTDDAPVASFTVDSADKATGSVILSIAYADVAADVDRDVDYWWKAVRTGGVDDQETNPAGVLRWTSSASGMNSVRINLKDRAATTVTTAGPRGAQGAVGTAAAAALAAHEADTTGIHGIADTSVLATATSVATAVSNHAGASDPHGDRAYTDAQIAAFLSTAFDFKASVRAATTANITLSGAQTIDGVSVVAGNRVLVKNQSAGAENGIYVAASGAWTRSTDADADAEVTAGLSVPVEEGTVGGGRVYLLTTANPITVGSTSLSFSLVDAGDLRAANNLSDVSSPSTARTNLGVAIGTNVQAWDADLDAFAALTSAANKMPYSTGAQAWALADLTAFVRTLLDDANAAAFLATLGTGTMALEAATSYVAKALYDANTILYATTDDTPVALTVGASTIVGRKASGNIVALTASEVATILALASTNISDFAAAAWGAAQPINAQTGTTYTVATGDTGYLVTLNNASAITVTFPQDSDATFAVGKVVDFYTFGAGQVTYAQGTGATLRTSGLTSKSRAQYSRQSAQKVAANTWLLSGDLAAS